MYPFVGWGLFWETCDHSLSSRVDYLSAMTSHTAPSLFVEVLPEVNLWPYMSPSHGQVPLQADAGTSGMGAGVRVLHPPGCHDLPGLRAAGTLRVSLPALFLGTERLRQKEVAQLMENPLSLSILRSKNTRGLSSA